MLLRRAANSAFMEVPAASGVQQIDLNAAEKRTHIPQRSSSPTPCRPKAIGVRGGLAEVVWMHACGQSMRRLPGVDGRQVSV